MAYIIQQLTVIKIDENGQPVSGEDGNTLEYDVGWFDCSDLCDQIEWGVDNGRVILTPIKNT